MDYEALAGELLSIRGNLLQVPANQKLSKMLRGELFVLNYEEYLDNDDVNSKYTLILRQKECHFDDIKTY